MPAEQGQSNAAFDVSMGAENLTTSRSTNGDAALDIEIETSGVQKLPKTPVNQEDLESENKCSEFVKRIQIGFTKAYIKHKTSIRRIIYGLILVAFHCFLLAALIMNPKKAYPLLIMTIFAWLLVFYYLFFVPRYWTHCLSGWGKLNSFFALIWKRRLAKLLTYLGIVVAFLVIFVGTVFNPWRLLPMAGLLVFVLLMLIFSTSPTKIHWRPVLWGLGLQLLMGLVVLRWSVGEAAVGWASEQVTIFLRYVDVGSDFVFSYLAVPSPEKQSLGFYGVFAFSVSFISGAERRKNAKNGSALRIAKDLLNPLDAELEDIKLCFYSAKGAEVLPVIIYVSSFVSILYYFGIIQFVVMRVSLVMQYTMGTTAAESLSCASNIFLGQTEAPLLIKPYLPKMTKSEIHAVMTGGFATVAGAAFGAYVRFGACPSHLLTASVMSAPAALAISKLFYPETEKSLTKLVSELKLEPSEEKNCLEAFTNGASVAIFLCLNIGANIIVFLSFLAFLNNVVQWLGDMVNIYELTLEKIYAYLFFPLAFLMGCSDLEDSTARNKEIFAVARLLGTKTFLNEFIAYEELGRLIHCCQLSVRAQVVSTYALCGFSNLAGIGIQIGGLSVLCPEKTSVFASVAVRALIAGSVACFSTACIAGILIGDNEAACSYVEHIASFPEDLCLTRYGVNRTAACHL